MSDKEKSSFIMKVQGVANGSTSYEAKNGKWYHSGLLLVPGNENCLKIGLTKTNPNDFSQGSVITMNVLPVYWNGKFNGVQEA